SLSACRRGARPLLHPFPTRRSSDLTRGEVDETPIRRELRPAMQGEVRLEPGQLLETLAVEDAHLMVAGFHHHEQVERIGAVLRRSEEHTSELQSRENLVCRLLLEKK